MGAEERIEFLNPSRKVTLPASVGAEQDNSPESPTFCRDLSTDLGGIKKIAIKIPRITLWIEGNPGDIIVRK